jgi:hypothetical protein
VRLQEGLLHEILRVGRIAQQTAGDIVQAARVRPVQLLEGPHFASPTALDERRICLTSLHLRRTHRQAGLPGTGIGHFWLDGRKGKRSCGVTGANRRPQATVCA